MLRSVCCLVMAALMEVQHVTVLRGSRGNPLGDLHIGREATIQTQRQIN